LRDKRLPYRDTWVTKGQFLIEAGGVALRELMCLEDRPTAIFCANDEMAIGATLECHRMGIRVPEELSIVGFDCSPTSEHVFPPITTIRQPIGELSAAAVRALVAQIEGKVIDFKTVFDTELVVRSSTAHPMEKTQ
jgi:LacI family transcriptional regulator, galactose operon repressor